MWMVARARNHTLISCPDFDARSACLQTGLRDHTPPLICLSFSTTFLVYTPPIYNLPPPSLVIASRFAIRQHPLTTSTPSYPSSLIISPPNGRYDITSTLLPVANSHDCIQSFVTHEATEAKRHQTLQFLHRRRSHVSTQIISMRSVSDSIVLLSPFCRCRRVDTVVKDTSREMIGLEAKLPTLVP
jgi:hypothetical protein